MAVRGHGRRRTAAMAATAVAGGVVAALLMSGCADPERAADGQDGKHAAGQVRQALGPGEPTEALTTVRRAAGILARSGGARVRTSMETVSGGTRLTIHGQGIYDFARPVGQLTVMLPEDAEGAAEHRPITEVFTPGALYMKNRGAGVPTGKWVRLEAGSLADGDLLTSGATDPLAAVELLGGARGVAYAGSEQLDGEQVAHYWGTIDLGRAARTAPERDRAALAAAAKGFSSGTVAFDAYVDGEGRPHLLRYRFGVAEAGAPAGRGRVTTAAAASAVSGAPAAPMTVVSTVELFSFGPAPDVSLPAPADIYAGTVASPQK
ncbi:MULTISPECIES: hypothetical protein [Streptomyces]|uniref:Lipoprotein n=1 Tax=Streptomyces morookaense TaxID=1970 RepID=A0A7Y7BA48_STRMO|nr:MULTISPECIES: hypothetical protein [Streptomyces]MCC2278581.1 hypothetical protein [Streptomyces sp. ET3-23]NVK81830.1 hypothetical protein [Streptomyces morookaense]GHF19050.1 lipoprotein [Streptomyces morookaense]